MQQIFSRNCEQDFSLCSDFPWLVSKLNEQKDLGLEVLQKVYLRLEGYGIVDVNLKFKMGNDNPLLEGVKDFIEVFTYTTMS